MADASLLLRAQRLLRIALGRPLRAVSPKKIKYVEPSIEPRRARKGSVEPIPEALITWRLTDVDVGGEWGWAKLTVDERSHVHDAGRFVGEHP